MSNLDDSSSVTTISLFDEEKKNQLIHRALTQLEIIKSEMNKFNNNATRASTKYSDISTKFLTEFANMKLKITSGRLSYEPKFNFRNGVLIGNNWYEEKLKYVKEKYKHDSTYSREFNEKERSSIPSEILWNYKIRGEGAGLQCVMDYDREKYLDNFSTTYDVSYNVLPKKEQDRKLKKYNARLQHYVPQQDLTENFGNVTGYGLKGRKTCQWQYEQNTEPSSWITETQDNYKLLSSENYKIQRRALPRKFSSILCETNLLNIHLSFRNTPISVVPDIPFKTQPRTYPHFYF